MGFFIFFVFLFFCFLFFCFLFLFFLCLVLVIKLQNRLLYVSKSAFYFVFRELIVAARTQYVHVVSLEARCAGVVGSHLLVEANDLFAGRNDPVTNDPHPERTNCFSGLETLLAYSERFAVADLSDDIQEGVELPDDG